METELSIIDKNQTGIASEFYVAAELFRRKWDVTLSFGNTKKFDLLAKKGKKQISVQVKGLHYTKSGNWNIHKSKVNPSDDMFVILVNLNCDRLELNPEFYILSSEEIHPMIRHTNKAGAEIKQHYIQYSTIKNHPDKFLNNWEKLEV